MRHSIGLLVIVGILLLASVMASPEDSLSFTLQVKNGQPHILFSSQGTASDFFREGGEWHARKTTGKLISYNIRLREDTPFWIAELQDSKERIYTYDTIPSYENDTREIVKNLVETLIYTTEGISSKNEKVHVTEQPGRLVLSLVSHNPQQIKFIIEEKRTPEAINLSYQGVHLVTLKLSEPIEEVVLKLDQEDETVRYMVSGFWEKKKLFLFILENESIIMNQNMTIEEDTTGSATIPQTNQTLKIEAIVTTVENPPRVITSKEILIKPQKTKKEKTRKNEEITNIEPEIKEQGFTPVGEVLPGKAFEFSLGEKKIVIEEHSRIPTRLLDPEKIVIKKQGDTYTTILPTSKGKRHYFHIKYEENGKIITLTPDGPTHINSNQERLSLGKGTVEISTAQNKIFTEGNVCIGTCTNETIQIKPETILVNLTPEKEIEVETGSEAYTIHTIKNASYELKNEGFSLRTTEKGMIGEIPEKGLEMYHFNKYKVAIKPSAGTVAMMNQDEEALKINFALQGTEKESNVISSQKVQADNGETETIMKGQKEFFDGLYFLIQNGIRRNVFDKNVKTTHGGTKITIEEQGEVDPSIYNREVASYEYSPENTYEITYPEIPGRISRGITPISVYAGIADDVKMRNPLENYDTQGTSYGLGWRFLVPKAYDEDIDVPMTTKSLSQQFQFYPDIEYPTCNLEIELPERRAISAVRLYYPKGEKPSPPEGLLLDQWGAQLLCTDHNGFFDCKPIKLCSLQDFTQGSCQGDNLYEPWTLSPKKLLLNVDCDKYAYSEIEVLTWNKYKRTLDDFLQKLERNQNSPLEQESFDIQGARNLFAHIQPFEREKRFRHFLFGPIIQEGTPLYIHYFIPDNLPLPLIRSLSFAVITREPLTAKEIFHHPEKIFTINNAFSNIPSTRKELVERIFEENKQIIGLLKYPGTMEERERYLELGGSLEEIQHFKNMWRLYTFESPFHFTMQQFILFKELGLIEQYKSYSNEIIDVSHRAYLEEIMQDTTLLEFLKHHYQQEEVFPYLKKVAGLNFVNKEQQMRNFIMKRYDVDLGEYLSNLFSDEGLFVEAIDSEPHRIDWDYGFMTYLLEDYLKYDAAAPDFKNLLKRLKDMGLVDGYHNMIRYYMSKREIFEKLMEDFDLLKTAQTYTGISTKITKHGYPLIKLYDLLSSRNVDILGHLTTFIDTAKPNALIIFPASDWNSAFYDYMPDHLPKTEALTSILDEYDYLIIIAEDKTDIEEIAKEMAKKGILFDTVIIGGHGDKQELILFTEHLTNNHDRDHKITISDTDLATIQQMLKKDAHILLMSCSTGEGREKEKNLANFIQLVAGDSRMVFAPTIPQAIGDMKTKNVYPLEVTMTHDNKDVTYTATYKTAQQLFCEKTFKGNNPQLCATT